MIHRSNVITVNGFSVAKVNFMHIFESYDLEKYGHIDNSSLSIEYRWIATARQIILDPVRFSDEIKIKFKRF